MLMVSVAHGGSDEMNNPVRLKAMIQKSQFIFVGRLKIKARRFIDNEHRVVADKDGKINKAFHTNKFENAKIIPEFVMRWAVITSDVMLKRDIETVAPFLTDSWMEPSLVICPHHSNALDGGKRIWIVSLSERWEVSLTSMPMKHLVAVQRLMAKPKAE